MKTSDFDFYLPAGHIARFPPPDRENSRLMLINRKTQTINHYLFKDITKLVSTDDFFVANNTRVIPARIFAQIKGNPVEMLICQIISSDTAIVLARPAKKFQIDQMVIVNDRLNGKVINRLDQGKRVIQFDTNIDVVLKNGFAPLPPYIKRTLAQAQKYQKYDRDRYQTIYALNPGSIAAPTAGLHFTPGIIAEIKKLTEFLEITLTVGEATFQKISTDDIQQHNMGTEQVTINKKVISQITALKKKKQLIAIGTTTVRALESYGFFTPEDETFFTHLFIQPGFNFHFVDKLITNFHLPKSSLFILVCAFAGLNLMKKAYQIAIDENYRFYSYGDAMLIV